VAEWHSKRDEALRLLEREKQPSVRAAAARQIWELSLEHSNDAADFGPALLRLLADPQEEVRRAGLRLGRVILPPEELEPVLMSRLSDNEPGVRVEAVGILADLENPSYRPALTAALGDAVFGVRFEAARGLAALQHRAGLDVLVEALGHDEMRFRALGALAQLGDSSAVPAIRKIYQRWLLPTFERTQAAGALAKLGDTEAALHLMKRTRRRWAVDRAFAIELCGDVKAPGAFERLLEILRDASDPNRGAAARGLGRLGNTGALEPLSRLLDETSATPDLRLDAAEGLCLLGTPEARAKVEEVAAAAAHQELKEILEQYS
jgi:HEAT repeat protein